MNFPKILTNTGRVLVFLGLTVLTQTGGVVYLINFSTYRLINKRIANGWLRRFCKPGSFILMYLVATFLIVPLLARPLGRVQMPLKTTNNLRPLTFLTCLLNRNYVRKDLREAAFTVAGEMNKKYPGTVINYLDANFPFLNGFPLFPHLSHNDGKKLDLAFCYQDKTTLTATNEAPSLIGYGICEEPTAAEKNTAEFCSQNGYWQYSFLKNVMPQHRKNDFLFYGEKTKCLVTLFCQDNRIGKVFIEPHLKLRLQLSNSKIRFHGCRAVRHDDHIHVQLN
ncbi:MULTISPECIES: hypothetical protein [Niastella]|uniref:Uncharacterized protein n=1 Tax=Niastella soli TaxID=2821487 RepID=A0ABS3YVT5_9BACT|nr:hypothetical protein [Niastella soli]MBO9201281.1 hypothetical protein [Niastella soli]